MESDSTGKQPGPPPNSDVFLDEAGNTGLNLNDGNQPLFTLGGWIVPRERQHDVARVVSATLRAGQTEAKGRVLIGTPRGRVEASQVLQSLLKLGCLPTFGVSEKRYAICGKVVENFLDPPTNPVVEGRFTNDGVRKIAIADRLYGLSDSAIEKAWSAFWHPEPGEVAAALKLVIADCRTARLTFLADLLAGARGHTAEIARLLTPVASDPVSRTREGLHMPVLVSLISQLELLFERTGMRDVAVIHDATREFAPVIQWAFETTAGALPYRERLSNGNTLVLGLKSINRIEFRDSSGCSEIQAADILASTMNWVLSASDAEITAAPELLESLTWVARAGVAIEGLWIVMVGPPLRERFWKRLQPLSMKDRSGSLSDT